MTTAPPPAAPTAAPASSHATPADRVVAALVEEGLLRPEDRARSTDVVGRALSTPVRASGGLSSLVEVVAYLGGALVLAAGSLFLVDTWGDLGLTGQLVLLGVVAVVLGVAGAVAAGVPGGREALLADRHDVRRRLGGTLLVGSALAATFLVGLLVDDLTPDADYTDPEWAVIAAALTLLLACVAAYRVAPTALAQLGMMAGLVTAVTNLVNEVESDGEVWIGCSLLVLAVLWLAITEWGAFHERTVARVLGVGVALVGAQLPVGGDTAWLAYLLTVLVALAAVALYLARAAWPYLAVTVVAITVVVPEAVSDWTEGSLGVVGAVLLTGITLLAASFAGYRLRAEATE